MLTCIYLAPYTKVEESFNLQTIHDFLFLGPKRLKEFDHFEFPGVVPRTCFSGLIISLLVYPYHLLFEILGSKGFLEYSLPLQKYMLLFAARGTLGFLTVLTWMRLGNTLGRLEGRNRELWFLLFSITQFHFLFWGSRPLPNIFALVLSNMGIACWIQAIFAPTPELSLKLKMQFLGWMIPAAVIFRMECLFFAAFVFLCDLTVNSSMYPLKTIFSLARYSLAMFVMSLLVTVSVDSVFWQGSIYDRTGVVWPEGYVFFFNAILGKSVAWGVLPFKAYFTSFLPKALGAAYVISLCGFLWACVLGLSGRTSKALCVRLLSPALLFVLFMSNLGHKEWRFLVYVFPVFNLAAAETVSSLTEKINRPSFLWLVRFMLMAALAANFAFAGISVLVSSINYPGGDALSLAHQLYRSTSNTVVHIDASAAITGISRFGQLSESWIYDKNENLKPGQDFVRFDCLLTGSPEPHSPDWEPTAIAYGFDRLKLSSLASWSKSLMRSARLDFPELTTVVPQLKGLHHLHNMSPKRISALYWVQLITPVQVIISPKIFVLRKAPLQEI
ncbi:dolichyl-P-Man:Man(7)GlcNAc(2)-PP-dolichol alpha-1,6-mannosyltransferase [Entomophthora muscae]|uniref:Dolichyl-P-Man:Man(7)GlcNAc(2)-PP-dolichol alpha-1,6-mannosyltransferase n=1 Tax=Entomophthora muscae TaxID=34485 RepID=A0ACC2RIA4_9FUNG|nr:dolichyl-P-Man:Man(7)GlcNAc(2)-PP-dolichol alpha-1,6-mannosyltransferase [Entomophthora muscae]